MSTRAERRAKRLAELELQRRLSRGDFSGLVIDTEHQEIRLPGDSTPSCIRTHTNKYARTTPDQGYDLS